MLVKEQHLHLNIIDNLKCAKSEKCIDATCFALLVAVKHPLGQQPDGGLMQLHPNLPYQWPAFFDRGIFEGGDLLPLDFITANSKSSNSTLPNSDDVRVQNTMQLCDDMEKLLHVVQDLNARLGTSSRQ